MDINELMAMDHEILDEIIRKNNEKFARKWNLATICIAVPSLVKEQLKRDFNADHPDLDFDEEYGKCLRELSLKRVEETFEAVGEALARRFKNDSGRE